MTSKKRSGIGTDNFSVSTSSDKEHGPKVDFLNTVQ
jgi:hypothetical protein